MVKRPIPLPPEAADPIVVLRKLSLHAELEFLTEFTDAIEAKDVDRAARCALKALDSPMERDLVDSLVSVVNNHALTQVSYPPTVKALLCRATDLGYHEHAYNAANLVMADAKAVRAYKDAERYYKIAMAYDKNPKLQAAAHVNYCPLIRDGLLTGKPDWPAAVEIYEVAARMGLAKAMFNAGNVSSWIASSGNRAYGARAAHWYQHALSIRDAKQPTLDMESREELEAEVYENCRTALSALHIDKQFDGADLEEGIRWARKARWDNLEARHNLGIAYTKRLTAMTTSPGKSPGDNWRAVLSQLDWQFVGDTTTITVLLPTQSGRSVGVQLDKLKVKLDRGGELPLFVTHDACLPLDDGFHLLGAIANVLTDMYPNGLLLTTRKAFFVEDEGSIYTPIYVVHGDALSRQTLWTGSSPDLVLHHARDAVPFIDSRFATRHCMVSIAVNALDEGFVVATDVGFGQPWAGVGDPWRMPFVDERNLLKVGILLNGSPRSKPPTRRKP